jgi:hypothetical protein
MRRALFLILAVLAFPVSVHAYYFAGLTFDTSSNMLLRPNGKSGTIISLDAGISRNITNIELIYTFTGGILQHYDGLQYNRHIFNSTIPIIQRNNKEWFCTFDGIIARYGDVTALNGYNNYSFSTSGKVYMTPSLLFRWEGRINHNEYSNYKTENYTGAQTYLRLDRFFESGKTLRAQYDFGIRNYNELEGYTPVILIGGKVRYAQSFGSSWGGWGEFAATKISESEAITDTTLLNDRLFLDDPYQYSKSGFAFNLKHLLRSKGSVQLRTNILTRTYDNSLQNAYWYLPDSGWEEHEISLYLTTEYTFSWFPTYFTPTIDIYYTDVHASYNVLSYRSFGMMVSLMFR